MDKVYRVEDLEYTIDFMVRYMSGIVNKKQLIGLMNEGIKVGIGMVYIDKCLELWKYCKK